MSACIIHHSITSKCIISLWVHAILMQALQQKDQASNIFITEKWKYGSDKCKCFISSYFLNFIWINHFWILWIISENDTILLFWIFLLFQIVDHLNFLTSLFFWPFFLIFDLLSFWPLNITIFLLTSFFYLFTFWPLNIMIFWPFCLFQFDLYICPQRGQIEIDKKVKKS